MIAALCDGLAARGHDVDALRRRLVDDRARRSRGRATALRDAHDAAGAGRGRAPPSPSDARRCVRAGATTSTSSTPTSTCGRFLRAAHGHAVRPDAPRPPRHRPCSQRVLPLYPDVPLVSISDNQRRPLAASAAATGRARSTTAWTWPRTAATDVPRADHLAFLGRISPEKRPDLGVEVARRTGRPAPDRRQGRPRRRRVPPDDDRAAARRRRRPSWARSARLDKPAFLAGAAATLFPSDWPEPFGLVMIESMAAGTPVIALRRGLGPRDHRRRRERLHLRRRRRDGRRGRRLDEIDPEACRRQAAGSAPTDVRRRRARGYRALGARAASSAGARVG